jgi:hypothetical protein
MFPVGPAGRPISRACALITFWSVQATPSMRAAVRVCDDRCVQIAIIGSSITVICLYPTVLLIESSVFEIGFTSHWRIANSLMLVDLISYYFPPSTP